MTDLYTKFVLTVIAAALSVNVLISLKFVSPADANHASGVQRVVLCNPEGHDCASMFNRALKITVD
jgi:hypothetical protein